LLKIIAKGSASSTATEETTSAPADANNNKLQTSTGQRILASPLAKIASDKGIQLTQVKVLVKMDVS
jgi:hypothetical protein